MAVEFMTTILPIVMAGVWALVGYVNSWLSPEHEPDWSKMCLTFLLGAIVAAYMTYTGLELTYDTLMLMSAAYLGIVAGADKAVHALMKIFGKGSSS